MNNSSRGFSLIEILVGLAIGLIGMLVMVQVFTLTETGKRTTSGGDEAQNAGAIALYTLQRDLRQSGFGITNAALIGCNVTLPSGVVINAIAPVTINHPDIPVGDANTDTLLTFSGNGNGAQQGDLIVTQTTPNDPRSFTMASAAPYAINDQVIAQLGGAVPGAGCNLNMEPITAITPATPSVSVATGLNGSTKGTLYHLGNTPRIIAYAVRNGSLTSCNFMQSDCRSDALVDDSTIWVPITGNVVSLRADYGQDLSAANMDAVVDTYNQTTPGPGCGLSRILTTRIVLVVRNNSFDKADVTSTAPSWMGTANAPIVLNTLTDWTHYRYKLFQTEIPLRNMIGVANGYVIERLEEGKAPC